MKLFKRHVVGLVCMSLIILSGSEIYGQNRELAMKKSTNKTKVETQAVTPNKIVIPYLEEKLVIDGQFTEPVWQQAAVISPFLLNDGTKPGTENTELRLFYTSEYLCLGWTCQDTDIQATMKQRDSDLWDEEVCESFLAPVELTKYFELQWNPLGTIFDAIITNTLGSNGLSKNISGDRTWNAANMKSMVVVDGKISDPNKADREWRVEVQIPFVDLKVTTPKAGDVWRGNFYRYNRTGKLLELLAWSPTRTPSFHEPNRFGYLEFGNPKVSQVQNWERKSGEK